jgi:hypothetical protein
VYLYYKERRQLKIFLTQIRPALPLTPDPPVRLRDDQKGGTTIKIAISEVFPPKMNYFCHPPRIYPRSVPTFGPTCEILLCAYVAREHAAAQATRCPGGGHAARRPCLGSLRDPRGRHSRGCWPELACPPRSHSRWYGAPMAAADSRGCRPEFAWPR